MRAQMEYGRGCYRLMDPSAVKHGKPGEFWLEWEELICMPPYIPFRKSHKGHSITAIVSHKPSWLGTVDGMDATLIAPNLHCKILICALQIRPLFLPLLSMQHVHPQIIKYYVSQLQFLLEWAHRGLPFTNVEQGWAISPIESLERSGECRHVG